MTMSLTSPAFKDGERMPDKYARQGDNLMPPLDWGDVPEGTRSFAIIVEDPDAPRGTFRHCGLYNIPGEWDGLAQGAASKSGNALRFSRNDFGNHGYDGPQPPKGHGLHHYRFRLAALNVPSLNLPEEIGVGDMWAEVNKHLLFETTLTGTYEVT